jgi:hypothetical protein
MATPWRPPDGSKQDDNSKQFLFVHNATITPSDKQAKRHIMEEYVRRKKSIQGAHQPATRRLLRRILPSPMEKTNQPIKQSPQDKLHHRSKVASTAIVPIDVISDFRNTTPSPSPQSPLDSEIIDPFDTLPLSLNKSDNILFHHFMYEIPRRIYGSRDGGIIYNRPGLLFPIAMSDSTCFHFLVLGFAATHRAFLQGNASTIETETHHVRAITMLREYFRLHPSDISDRSIYLVLAQCSHDGASLDPSTFKAANMHWQATMRMIRLRGGPQAFYLNRSMTSFFCRVDYSHRSYDKAMTPHVRDNSVEPPSIIDDCEHFITFLHDVHINSLEKRLHCLNSPLYQSLFGPGSAIHSILTSPPGDLRPDVSIRVQMTSALAIALSLHHGLLEYANSPPLSNRYLQDLSYAIDHYDLETKPSITLLLEVLTVGSNDPSVYSPARAWEVGRFLRTAKRLSLRSWDCVMKFLLDVLANRGPEAEDESGFFEWMKALSMEILTTPPSAKIMPALVELEERVK